MSSQENNQEPQETKQRPNKTQLKREMDAVREQAKALCDFNDKQLEQLGIEGRLLEAIQEHRRIKQGNAQKRQLQFITKLLAGRTDLETLLEGIKKIQDPNPQLKKVERECENILSHLLENNQDTIDRVLDNHKLENRQQFMQLLRNAQKEARGQIETPASQLKQRQKLKKLIKTLLQ